MRWTHKCAGCAGRPTGLALILTLLSVTTVAVAREPPGPAPWDYFAGDLTIRHQRLSADGQPAGMSPPAMVVRLERQRASGRWRTTLDVTATEPTWVQSPGGRRSLDNRFAISRIEFEHDGAPPRMFDRRGELVNGPTPADIRALGLPAGLRGRDWDPEDLIARSPGIPGLDGAAGPAAGLIHLAGEQSSRRQDLERRYGQPVGQLRGLDRFLSQTADVIHELLVDPDTALPVEINVADEGVLVRHATFDYESIALSAGSALLRSRLRNEQVVPESSGMRLVTEIELTNVRLTEGRP
jgi:hypothetical protein